MCRVEKALLWFLKSSKPDQQRPKSGLDLGSDRAVQFGSLKSLGRSQGCGSGGRGMEDSKGAEKSQAVLTRQARKCASEQDNWRKRILLGLRRAYPTRGTSSMRSLRRTIIWKYLNCERTGRRDFRSRA